MIEVVIYAAFAMYAALMAVLLYLVWGIFWIHVTDPAGARKVNEAIRRARCGGSGRNRRTR